MATVSELIDKLLEFDLSLPVYLTDSEYGPEPLELDWINVEEAEEVLTMRSLPRRVQI